ncbi:hypothetical protein E4U50_005639 [Claviceps purpurea]|nr:hypothetical protein E4U50_005639 [Claviceps purpurea]
MASMTPYTLPVLKPPTAMGSCRWSLILSPTGGSPTTASRKAHQRGSALRLGRKSRTWWVDRRLRGPRQECGAEARTLLQDQSVYESGNKAGCRIFERGTLELVSAAPPFASSDIDAASFWAPELIFFCVE